MVNQGTILGRVGKIDIKSTNSGTKIANLSMVTSKKFMKDGQKQEKTTWHNVTMFNKIAEIAEKYVTVGDMLYVQGEMDTQKWTDQQGQTKTKSFLLANEMKLLPNAKNHKSTPEPKQDSAPGGDPFALNDDVPF